MKELYLLDNEFLKELLMEINDFEEIKVGDKKIKPKKLGLKFYW